jgi:hypothetical protein
MREKLTWRHRLAASYPGSNSTLQSLGLPGAITALERPTGLPPALLSKAEEVYTEGGVEKVHRLISSVTRLAQTDAAIIEEVSIDWHTCPPHVC